MPFISVCPYCGKGKVRASERMAGSSVPCPSCHTCFTLAAPDPALRYQAGNTPGQPDRPEEIASSSVATATISKAPTDIEPKIESNPNLRITIAVPDSEDNSSGTPALVAMILGGVAIIATQFPYGRWIALGLLAIGFIVGLLSLMSADRQVFYPRIATALNLFGLLLILAFPDWLGLRSAWDRIAHDDPNIVKSVDPATGLGVTAEWIDIGKAWQQNDFRVTLGTISAGPIEVLGNKGLKFRTKEKYLQIPVTAENVGIVRKIEFIGWSQFETKPDPKVPVIRLTDGTGRAIAEKKPDPKFELTFPAILKTGLYPGKSTTQVLLFEVPDRTVTELKLELPSVLIDSKETIRFRIPKNSLPWN